MRPKQLHIAIVVTLVLLGATLRMLPHPANFAPVAALAIFGGALLPKRSAVLVPLLIMIISDLIIGVHSLILVTWGCYALIAWASHVWLTKRSAARGVELTVAASIFFYFTTNFAVWLTSGMYAHTFSGLARCFTLALPFFRNTLASDIIYTAALFGIYGLASHTHNQQSAHV